LLVVVLSGGPAAAEEPSGLQAAAAIEKVLVEAVARAEKSVVAIARVRREPPDETLRPEFRPDPFARRPLVSAVPQPTDPNFVPNEYGTGVVIDRRGLILTAYHVLGEDSDYYVTTLDRRVYRAWVKAADPRSDLAVLALDTASGTSAAFVPISLGDTTSLRRGQFVLTLGNPYAIARDGQPSAGWGIVANLARKAPPLPDESDPTGKRTLHHFGTLIQTDAKLNLGTSGGPLVNLRGEMVGLCVALAAATGYETPAGYAIPVDATFRRVLEVLKEGREVEYGFLGVQLQNLDPHEILAGLHGARVDHIVPGTPAARYGLHSADVITAVDGAAIYDADAVVLEVSRLPVESVVRLGVLRDGQSRTVEVTLGKYPVRGKKIVTLRPDAWRGIRVDYSSAYVEPDLPARGNLPLESEAVVVAEVQPDTPAAKAGLKSGMFISQVDGRPVRTPKEFRASVAGKTAGVQLRIPRAEQTDSLLVVPPQTAN
jgi:S1-C subfamily serine protease